MSGCTLSVQLDRPDHHHALGERVSGAVSVQADTACECRGLKVTRLWRAHGHARSSDGAAEERTLFEGTWEAGQSYRYAFEFDIPGGPLSYRGKELSIDWLIAAQADVPSASDPRAEQTFVVDRDSDPSRVELPTVSRPEQVARYTLAKAILKAVGGVMIGGIGLVVLVLSIQGVLAGQGAGWIGLIAGAVFALPGAGLTVSGLLALLGTSLARSVDVRLEPARCRPGGILGVSLRLLPRRAFAVSGIAATLQGREILVVRGSKTSDSFEHVLHHERQPIGTAQAARPDVPVVAAGDLRVPEGAPPSFRLDGSFAYWEIEWSVTVQIHVRWFPDWVRAYPFVVGP